MPTDEFKRLKTKSYRQRQWDSLLQNTHPLQRQWSETHIKKITNHLISSNDSDREIGLKIRHCNTDGYGFCGSIYCKKCCSRLADKMLKRWVSKINNDKPIYAVTLLDGVSPINNIEMSEAVDGLRYKLQKIKKTIPFPFLFDGFVEFEVVDTAALLNTATYSLSNQRKLNFVKHKADKSLHHQPTVIPHIHSIIQFEDERLLGWVKKLFQKHFGNNFEVVFKRTPFQNQSIEEGLANWANYILKWNNRWFAQKFIYKNHFEAQLFAKTDAEANFIDFYTLIEFLKAHYTVSGSNNKGLQLITSKNTSDFDWAIEDFE